MSSNANACYRFVQARQLERAVLTIQALLELDVFLQLLTYQPDPLHRRRGYW